MPSRPAYAGSRGESESNLREKVLAYVLVAFTFLLVLFGEYLGVSISTAVYGLFSSLFVAFYLARKKLYLPFATAVPFLIFIFAVILSSFTSQVPQTSLREFILYASSLSIFILAFQFVHRKRAFVFWFLNIFWTIGTLIVLFFFLKELASGAILRGSQFVGPFLWHNQMAAFLGFLVPISLAQIFVRSKKIVPILITLFLFLTFALTYSRAAWMSMGFGLFLLALLWRRYLIPKGKKALSVSLVIVISIILITQIPPVSERIKSLFGEITGSRSVSASLRISAYSSAYEMFSDYPLVGIGPGGFGEAYFFYQKNPWLYAKHTHNHFLQVASEIGILGFVPFALIFLSFFYVLLKNRGWVARKKNKRKLIISVLGISVLISSVHNLFDVDWNFASLSYLFWLFAGIFIGSIFKKGGAKTGWVGTKKLTYFLLILLFFASLKLFYVERTQAISQKAYNLGWLDTSFKATSQVTGLAPYYYAPYILQARILELRGDPESALAKYAKAISLNSFNADPVYKSGLIFSETGSKDMAKIYFRRAIELNSFSDPQYYNQLAQILLEEGKTEEAEAVLKKAVEDSFPVNESYLSFSYLYETTGFNKILANTYLSYARILIKQNKKDLARKVVNDALTHLDQENQELKKLRSSLEEK